MSSSSSLTAASSVTGRCGARGSPSGWCAPRRAAPSDSRTALAPEVAPVVAPRADPLGGALGRSVCAAPAGRVAQSGAATLTLPHPALVSKERPVAGGAPGEAPCVEAPARATPPDPPPLRRSPAAPPTPPGAERRCGPGEPLGPPSSEPGVNGPGASVAVVAGVGWPDPAISEAATSEAWIPSTTASTPSSSMSAWRTISAWLPDRKVFVSPAVAMPRVSVVPSYPMTWACWETNVHVMRRREKMRPSTSGQARRIASVSMPPAAAGADAGAGSAWAGGGPC